MGEAPETTFLCIVPQDYKDLRMEMTPFLYDKFIDMEKFLLIELEKLNIKLERLPDA
jgi:hypothetical protein